jgi:hypothetical protein
MRLTLFLLYIISINFCLSQQDIYKNQLNNYNAFKSGEKLEYRLNYGFLNASYASLTLKQEVLNGQKVFRATSIGRTTGLARLFFKVEDIYETFFPLDQGRPVKSIRDIYEGGYEREAETIYDYDNNKAKFYDKLKNIKKEFDIHPGIQDIISTFYYLRKHFDIESLKPNDLINVDIFFGQEIYPFKMMFLGIEKIKTKFGILECMKLRPYMESGRVFRDNEGIKLWVTNDNNRVPIKVKADLRVGSIVANLVSFRGLANPFKIVVSE